MTIYSNKAQLEKIANYLTAYMRIPYFQDDSIPGKIMEKIISLVRDAKQLSTYDYVDVVRKNDVGWQVKSTQDSTPLTWKRAKIPDSERLIKESERSDEARQILGDIIIEFCNNHAKERMSLYNLHEIGYSRLIFFSDLSAVYFERLLCTPDKPNIFDKNDYIWHWSEPKKASDSSKKEQLPAFHGVSKKTGKKVFAWHGKGENQLHFSGEKNWWPEVDRPPVEGVFNYSADNHAIAFKLPSKKVEWDELSLFLNE